MDFTTESETYFTTSLNPDSANQIYPHSQPEIELLSQHLKSDFYNAEQM